MAIRFRTCVLFCLPLLCAQQPTQGIVPADMDLSVRPGDDFNAYTNGSWIKRTEIPADRTTVGVNATLADVVNRQVHDLIEETANSNPPAGSDNRRIADLYRSYLDEAGIEARGLAPLKPRLDAIAAIKNRKQLARALGESVRADVDALNNTNFHTDNIFGLWVAPGFNDVEHYAAYLMQGGLELPDRDYYLSQSPRMQEVRAAYLTHISDMLKLAGFSDAEQRARRVLDLEHAIAEAHLSLAECEDIHKANNTWKRSDFAAKAPGLDWAGFFRGAGLARIDSFIVWQPTAFTGEAALTASAPLEAWKDWLALHLIETYAGVLPKAFGETRFAFAGKALTGAQQQRPRWQLGVAVVNGRLGDAVGRIYVKRYFSADAKAQLEEMAANIIEAFRRRLNALTWMDPATKAEALAKLSTLYVGVGYPETWRDYSGYDVRPDDAFGNVWRGHLYEYHRQIARIGRPIDRREWSMTPQTVNAVNLPLQNALNFPAAYLQAPHFDPQAPSATNYGAIGTTIGHEVSHTFDTEGSVFDAQGRVRNWWTQADLDHFHAATEALAKQYDAYKPFPDLSLDGHQTLAENIADVAGLSAAFDAWQSSLKGKPAPVVGGFTGEQQFFVAFGQKWQSKAREASIRRQIATDPHSPGPFRVATVRNIDAWYRAFDVKPGEALYLAPADRVPVW